MKVARGEVYFRLSTRSQRYLVSAHLKRLVLSPHDGGLREVLIASETLHRDGFTVRNLVAWHEGLSALCELAEPFICETGSG